MNYKLYETEELKRKVHGWDTDLGKVQLGNDKLSRQLTNNLTNMIEGGTNELRKRKAIL